MYRASTRLWRSPVSARIFCVVAVAATVAGSLSGCSTYMDAKADALAGGPQQRVAAAQSNLTAAQTRNQDLQDQQPALQPDIARNEKRTTETGREQGRARGCQSV